MKPHRPFLELAAMAIDYPLTPPERRHLDEHLAGCQACERTAVALRSDAAAIGSLPPITLPERRGDRILAAALHPASIGRPLRLVAIAALLGLLITGSIAAGALLLERSDDDLSIVVPLPSPTPSLDAGPTSSTSPKPIVFTPWGNLVATRAEGGSEWVELLGSDASATRLAPGSDPRWLSADRIVYFCPTASPDFLGTCVVDPDSPDAWQPFVAEADQPAPAPDGRSIAFHRGTIDVGETWLVQADGSGSHRLATGRFLAWSPDGAWLAGQPESSTREVAIVGVDGTGQRTIAPGSDPAWSPFGERIAYAFVDAQGRGSLRTVDVATGDVTVLYVAPAGAILAGPAWVGDRAWVFVQDGDVWRLDAGADEPERLTTGLAIEPSLEGGPIAVSADDKWVAVGTGLGPTARVGLVWVDGGSDVEYPWPGTLKHPRWAPEAPPDAQAPSEPAPSAEASGDTRAIGSAWTAAAIPAVPGRPEGLVEAVAAGGPGFVAVGRGCNTSGDRDACEAIVWTSPDGRAWGRAPASDATDIGVSYSTSGPAGGMFEVVAGTPGTVAVGYAARPNLQATIWFSRDGSSWERIPLGLDGSGTDPGVFLATRVNAVTWDGRSFVAVGADRSDFNGRNLRKAKARAAVWTSPDGRTWTRVPHGAAFDAGGFVDTGEDPSSGGMHDVVAGPGGLVAVGTVCTNKPRGCQPAAWASTDGTSWGRAADMPAVPGWPTSVTATDAGYVAVGGPLVLTSPDGRAWTQQAFDPEGGLQTVATIDNRLYASSFGPVTLSTSDHPVTLWASDDGSAWVPATHDGGPATEGGGPSDWRLAATSDVVVWLGRDADTDAPAAWVSETGRK